MSKIQMSNIIDTLEAVMERPDSYMSPNFPEAVNFFEGFNVACAIWGYSMEIEAYKKAVIERGWEFSSGGTWIEMEDKGYDRKAITKEMLSIYIDMWKIQQQKTGNEE